MAALASGLTLAENEKLVMEIEAELWASSSNPLDRLLGGLLKLSTQFSATRRKAFGSSPTNG
jgi:hypothetical protein